MALSTKINPRYRTPYMPRKELPESEYKLMRKEITNMRKDLLRKQARLAKSKDFQSDERLRAQLQQLKVRELKGTVQVWNTWNRLRELELSNRTSITGQKMTLNKTVESLRKAGYKGITNANLPAFGHFMEEMRTFYAGLMAGSDVVAQTFLNMYSDDIDFRNLTTAEQVEEYFEELLESTW